MTRITSRWRAGVAAFCIAGPAAIAAAAPNPAVRIEAGTVRGMAGERLTIAVDLRSALEVVDTASTLTFAPAAHIAARPNGRPACNTRPFDPMSNPPVPRIQASFTFRPDDCTAGVDCTAIRARIVVVDSFASLPEGLLYSCNLDVSSNAPPGRYDLVVSEVVALNPNGGQIPAGGTDGAVIVEEPTPTPTETPLPPTAAPTSTATVPPTVTPTRRHDGDGCMTAPPISDAGWLLLPLLAWRAARPRRRPR